MGDSFSTTPPLIFCCGLGRVCLRNILIFSTTARSPPRVKAQDLALLSTISPRENQHLIIFLDVQHIGFVLSLFSISYS